ncbi:hypothetical protein STAQ_43060 [Allostella sp. ATCC 35155]|nr:hypothetical protein STAQ_43060 [Stella sp. ATCC 35155]
MDRPFFSIELLEKYNLFMETCFSTFQGFGENPKIRIEHDRFKRFWSNQQNWDPAWLNALDDTNAASSKDIEAAYYGLIDQFAREITLSRGKPPSTSDRPTRRI